MLLCLPKKNFHASVFQMFISILWVLRKEKKEISLGLQEAAHNSWLMSVVSLEEFGLRSAFARLQMMGDKTHTAFIFL